MQLYLLQLLLMLAIRQSAITNIQLTMAALGLLDLQHQQQAHLQ